MGYNPWPFLITTAALTSLFNLFFGEYFRDKEQIYKTWLQVVVYGSLPKGADREEMCAMLEAKERMFRHGKALLLIMLLTLLACFGVFQLYSFHYIDGASPAYSEEAVHTYRWFTSIIGFLVFVNLAELVYVQIEAYPRTRFPFVIVRRRVTAAERMSTTWRALGCCCCKHPTYNRQRIPKSFYKALDRHGEWDDDFSNHTPGQG